MMKLLTLLITISISGGVLATETPGEKTTTENGIHKKMRKSSSADSVIDIDAPRKALSKNIEMNTLAHRALPGSGQ